MLVTKRCRRLFLFAIYIFLLVAGWSAGQWFLQLVDFQVRPSNEPTLHVVLMATAAIFILASALPFVPGAEIGFGLIMVFGGRIAFLVYVSMVAALVLAFLIGRFVPLSVVAAVFRYLGLKRSHDLIMQLTPLDAEERLALLTENAPRRFVPAMLRHRHLALMLLFNLPGNSIVGGGGGIAFTAGLSGLFSYPGFIAAVAVAIAPVPLFFFLTG